MTSYPFSFTNNLCLANHLPPEKTIALILELLLLLQQLLLILLPLSTSALLPAKQLLPIAATVTTDHIYSACVFKVALNSAKSHLYHT